MNSKIVKGAKELSDSLNGRSLQEWIGILTSLPTLTSVKVAGGDFPYPAWIDKRTKTQKKIAAAEYLDIPIQNISLTDEDVADVETAMGDRDRYILDRFILSDISNPILRPYALKYGKDAIARVQKTIDLLADLKKMKFRWDIADFQNETDYKLYKLYKTNSEITARIDTFLAGPAAVGDNDNLPLVLPGVLGNRRTDVGHVGYLDTLTTGRPETVRNGANNVLAPILGVGHNVGSNPI